MCYVHALVLCVMCMQCAFKYQKYEQKIHQLPASASAFKRPCVVCKYPKLVKSFKNVLHSPPDLLMVKNVQILLQKYIQYV
jgi:hypothetical protein